MKYIVYLTINTVNRKIYVGVHKTKDPKKFDGYIGCDIWHYSKVKLENPKYPFQKAVAKYGYEKFERITLGIFDTAEEAYLQESLIVTQKFVERKDTYNAALGGYNSKANSKRVLQYTKDGKFIREWPNMAEAAAAYSKDEQASRRISKVCRGIYKTTAGFQWRFYTPDYPKVIPPVEIGVAKRVIQYSLEGDFIKVWKSAESVGKALECKGETITRATQTLKQYKGYQWRKYMDHYPLQIEAYKDPKAVLQLDENGNIVKRWESKEAIKKAGFNNVSRSIKNRIRMKGHYWVMEIDYKKIVI